MHTHGRPAAAGRCDRWAGLAGRGPFPRCKSSLVATAQGPRTWRQPGEQTGRKRWVWVFITFALGRAAFIVSLHCLLLMFVFFRSVLKTPENPPISACEWEGRRPGAARPCGEGGVRAAKWQNFGETEPPSHPGCRSRPSAGLRAGGESARGGLPRRLPASALAPAWSRTRTSRSCASHHSLAPRPPGCGWGPAGWKSPTPGAPPPAPRRLETRGAGPALLPSRAPGPAGPALHQASPALQRKGGGRARGARGRPSPALRGASVLRSSHRRAGRCEVPGTDVPAQSRGAPPDPAFVRVGAREGGGERRQDGAETIA